MIITLTCMSVIDPWYMVIVHSQGDTNFSKLIEHTLFWHLHLQILECEDDIYHKGSGAMLFQTLKSIMTLLPQSASHVILKECLISMVRVM